MIERPFMIEMLVEGGGGGGDQSWNQFFNGGDATKSGQGIDPTCGGKAGSVSGGGGAGGTFWEHTGVERRQR